MSTNSSSVEELAEEDELPSDEEDWFQNEDPASLAECVSHRALGCVPISGFSQQLWLFSLACLDTCASELVDPRLQHAIELLSAYVEGRDQHSEDWNEEELRQAHDAAKDYVDQLNLRKDHPAHGAVEALRLAMAEAIGVHDEEIGYKAAEIFMFDVVDEILPPSLQCDLLREIFGDSPYPVTLDSEWLEWNNGELKSLAQDIYSQKKFERMTEFGASLEKAGCWNSLMLKHCKKNYHARGCWLLGIFSDRSPVIIEGSWLHQVPKALHDDDDGSRYRRTDVEHGGRATRVSFAGNGLRCFFAPGEEHDRISERLQQAILAKSAIEICISGKVLPGMLTIVDVR